MDERRVDAESKHSLCPMCGTSQLRLRRTVDRIDTLSSSVLSRMKKMLGAELHHCEFCRFQFYDFKKIEPAKVLE